MPVPASRVQAKAVSDKERAKYTTSKATRKTRDKTHLLSIQTRWKERETVSKKTGDNPPDSPPPPPGSTPPKNTQPVVPPYLGAGAERARAGEKK